MLKEICLYLPFVITFLLLLLAFRFDLSSWLNDFIFICSLDGYVRFAAPTPYQTTVGVVHMSLFCYLCNHLF